MRGSTGATRLRPTADGHDSEPGHAQHNAGELPPAGPFAEEAGCQEHGQQDLCLQDQ
jgi:hypothetical protein